MCFLPLMFLTPFLISSLELDVFYTITYKSRVTQKKLYKKMMLFLASMGETGLTHDIFFEFSLRPFEVVEAKGGRLVKEADFEAEILLAPAMYYIIPM